MKHQSFFYALTLLVAAGCKPEKPVSVAENPAVKTYDGRGIVRQISPDRHSATIKHEAIPGYMGAMTMDFTVKETNELNGISPDDEITFKLAVNENDSWIKAIRFVSHHVTEATNNVFVFHVVTEELKVGDPLPDGELTAENGRQIHFSDFRGRAVAFTFFFTSCPLPEFCPRMNKNFFEARKILQAETDAPANWQLLSISFDPGFDTPQILTSYGSFYRGSDTNRWLFAVASTNTLAELAPKVDLHFWREGGSISHNLRTVVLDTNEKIFKQFDGNDWTPQELADAIRAAAKILAN
jgi:protein SCO1/2